MAQEELQKKIIKILKHENFDNLILKEFFDIKF